LNSQTLNPKSHSQSSVSFLSLHKLQQNLIHPRRQNRRIILLLCGTENPSDLKMNKTHFSKSNFWQEKSIKLENDQNPFFKIEFRKKITHLKMECCCCWKRLRWLFVILWIFLQWMKESPLLNPLSSYDSSLKPFHDEFFSKFNANGGFRFEVEFIFGESRKKIRFTNTWITNQKRTASTLMSFWWI